jgi:hypothetical protein
MGNLTNPNFNRGAVQYSNHPGLVQHGKSRQQQSQYQVRQQAPPRQEKRVSDHGGFDGLLVGQRCRFKTGTGEVIEGLVVAASKFWYLVNVDGQIVIVNKAYVVSIMPIQNPNENNQQNTNSGDGNGREQPSGQK